MKKKRGHKVEREQESTVYGRVWKEERKGKIMSFSYNLKEIILERIDYVVKMCVSTVVS